MKPAIRNRTLILGGVISYLFFLLALAPASLVQHWLPAASGLRVSGLQGTLWAGQAASVQIQQHRLTAVNWSFNAWKLFSGQLAAEVEARYRDSTIRTGLGLTATGALILENTRAQLDAATVGELAQIPIAQLDGAIDIRLDQAELARGAAPAASGMILWQQASITVAESVSLGEVEIRMQESSDAPLLAVISNQGGDIRLDGEVSVEHNGDYRLQLNMKPSATSSDNIRNSLKMFARPQNDGSYQVDNQGNLKQLGLM